MLEVEVVHHFILDSCDAICVDDNVVVIEKVKGLGNIVEFIVQKGGVVVIQGVLCGWE